MIRLFLDSSVLYSAVYSPKGHSRDLILRAIRAELTLVVSSLVLRETKRNLATKAPDSLPLLRLVLQGIPFELVRPTKREVLEATKVVVLKDAPIVAAAKKAKVGSLVTLDRKHLLGKPKIEKYAAVPIITPKQAVERFR